MVLFKWGALHKALIAVCDLSSLNLGSLSDQVIRRWKDSANTPSICMNKKINRLINKNFDLVKRFIRLDESLIRLIRLADELVNATEITDVHKEQARAIISIQDRISLNQNRTENDAIYASAESLIDFLRTEEPE